MAASPARGLRWRLVCGAHVTFAAVAVALVVVAMTASAASAESIDSFEVIIDVAPDGSMTVTETITYDFGATQRHGIVRDIPTRFRFDDIDDRIIAIDGVSVSALGGPDDVEVTEESGGITRIRVGDPDGTVTGIVRYTIVYRVRGAFNGFVDHDELYWNATGDDWQATIAGASVVVRLPGPVRDMACFQGWDRSTEPCSAATYRGDVARFRAGRQLVPGEGLTIVIAVGKGVVAEPMPILEQRWSFGRAFAVTPTSVGLGAAALVVSMSGVATAAWRVGRDRRYRGSPVDQVMGSATGDDERVPLGEQGGSSPEEFAPPANLRPAHMGLLLDERPRTLHITATIVDLAVRGHLRIEEIEEPGFLQRGDWELIEGRPLDGDGPRYERLLLDGLFDGRSSVRVSELRNTFAERMERIRDALARDGMRQRWFVEERERVRGRWIGRGAVVMVGGLLLTFVLARWTHLGLVGLVVVGAGLALMVLAGRMPARTAKGFSLVLRIRGFRLAIEKADEHIARWAEQENAFTRMLAYAVVFGVTDKWAKAFDDIGQLPTAASWYSGQHAFTAITFAHAIDGFSVTAGGTLSSTPASSG